MLKSGTEKPCAKSSARRTRCAARAGARAGAVLSRHPGVCGQRRSALPPGPKAPERGRPTWVQAALVSAGAAVAGLVAGIWISQPSLDDTRREPAVASHVASLAPQRRLVDVVSTDRHTVKPWFAGKIDFAPPVRDLSAEGFAPVGGSLDHIADRQAAAVVYRLRNHDINLFVWRAANAAEREEIAVANLRGFGVATWAQDGLRLAAVSDLELRDLARFAELVRAPR